MISAIKGVAITNDKINASSLQGSKFRSFFQQEYPFYREDRKEEPSELPPIAGTTSENEVPITSDSITNIASTRKKDSLEDTPFRKAWLYSTILPGLGQAYNKKYWKIPILYAGFVGLAWGIIYNNREYLKYKRALFQEIDTKKNDLDLPESTLRNRTDNLRRDRDFLIIIVGLLYIVNIIDAHVDAHLKTFDVSDNLALDIQPYATPTIVDSPSAGISLTLRLKK